MAYVQLSDISGSLPAKFLTQALDDDGDGQQDPGLFDSLAAIVGTAIDGYIGLRYALPLLAPYPAVVLNTAQVFMLELLYKRRGTADDKNPWSAQAGQTRTLLKAISLGQSPLAPELNRKDPSASVVTERMQSVPCGRANNA